jgi:predicted O-methyltransferase YrrM
MSGEKWTEVDNYLSNKLIGADPILESALDSATAADLPAIAVSANQGKFLHLLARMVHARAVLEIGTLGGYSTIWLARALGAEGRLITLEIDPKHAEVAKASIRRAGLQDVVEVRVGNAVETLPQLSKEGRGPFDLIFIDADKENIPAYFEWALKLSRRGSVIVVDNVVRDGEVANADTTDPRVQGVQRFIEGLGGDPRATGTVIQTVGTKGYDGFAIVLVGEARE